MSNQPAEVIEGDRLWMHTLVGEVVCLDIGPLKRGQGTPRKVWKLDLAKEFGVFYRVAFMGDGKTCSIAPSYKNRIYVVTGNGADRTEQSIPAPQAPSLVCLSKDTGDVLWTDNSPAANILVGQWG